MPKDVEVAKVVVACRYLSLYAHDVKYVEDFNKVDIDLFDQEFSQ